MVGGSSIIWVFPLVIADSEWDMQGIEPGPLGWHTSTLTTELQELGWNNVAYHQLPMWPGSALTVWLGCGGWVYGPHNYCVTPNLSWGWGCGWLWQFRIKEIPPQPWAVLNLPYSSSAKFWGFYNVIVLSEIWSLKGSVLAVFVRLCMVCFSGIICKY